MCIFFPLSFTRRMNECVMRVCVIWIYLYHLLGIPPPVPLWFAPIRQRRQQHSTQLMMLIWQLPTPTTVCPLSSYLHALYDHGKRLEFFSRLRLLLKQREEGNRIEQQKYKFRNVSTGINECFGLCLCRVIMIVIISRGDEDGGHEKEKARRKWNMVILSNKKFNFQCRSVRRRSRMIYL